MIFKVIVKSPTLYQNMVFDHAESQQIDFSFLLFFSNTKKLRSNII